MSIILAWVNTDPKSFKSRESCPLLSIVCLCEDSNAVSFHTALSLFRVAVCTLVHVAERFSKTVRARVVSGDRLLFKKKTKNVPVQLEAQRSAAQLSMGDEMPQRTRSLLFLALEFILVFHHALSLV